MQNIVFKLNSKTQAFSAKNGIPNLNLDLLATASTYGIVIIGSVNAELIVAPLKNLESNQALTQDAPLRTIPLPSPANQISINCDGSILAVDVKISGTPHIQLYSVASFLKPVSSRHTRENL